MARTRPQEKDGLGGLGQLGDRRDEPKILASPTEIRRRRAMAEMLLAKGGETKHVDSPLELIGSLLQSGIGAYQQNRAAKDEKAGLDLRNSAALSMAFGANGAGAGFGSATGPIGSASEAPQGTASIPSGERASYIRSGLVSRGLPEHVADGFLANFQDESGLDPGINEAKPIVPGSRGGFGLYQLTGPRRRAYEAFAADRGVGFDDIDAQLDFMMGELQGPERAAAEKIFAAKDTAGAAQAIVTNFLRPAEEHRASRSARYARLGGSPALAAAMPEAGQMASERPVQIASLDPSDGLAQATARPRPLRTIIEDAAAQQGVTPGATMDPNQARGTVLYTGPALRDPNEAMSIAPVNMPGSSPETNAAIERFHAGNGTTPMQYGAGVPRSPLPGAVVGEQGEMMQTAALAPGSTPAQAGAPRSTRAILEEAYAQQMAAAGSAAPNGSAPAASPAPTGAALPAARPTPLTPDGYAAELPSIPPPPMDNQRRQQMAGFLIGEQPAQSAYRDPYTEAQIAQLLGNPWTEDLGQQALQQVIQNRQQFNDPMRRLQMEKAQLELNQLRNPSPDYDFTTVDGTVLRTDPRTGQAVPVYRGQRDFINVGGTLVDPETMQPVYQAPQQPTGDMQEYDAYRRDEEAAGRQPLGRLEYGQALRRSGANNTTITNGANGSKFTEKTDELAANRLNSIVEAGNAAPQFLGDVQQLADLGRQIGTGLGAQVMVRFGPWAEALGIDVEGLQPAQAYEAIVSRLAPQMRPAGSGASSDFDARQFLMSLPSIGNVPGANEIITGTFSAIAQNQMQAAEIASLSFLPPDQGGITWQEAEARIRQLPNPYQQFKQFQQGQGGGQQAVPMQQPQPAPASQAGGQRYEGGVPVGGSQSGIPTRATNPQTGQVIELRDGQWVPVQ